jgi:hypothetical protein
MTNDEMPGNLKTRDADYRGLKAMSRSFRAAASSFASAHG